MVEFVEQSSWSSAKHPPLHYTHNEVIDVNNTTNPRYKNFQRRTHDQKLHHQECVVVFEHKSFFVHVCF